MEDLSKQKKKELKQFVLNNKEECIIYLQNIIAIGVKCMENHKRFLQELEEIIERHIECDKVSYAVYSNISNKISNVESYMLNLFGDGQATSISYFKFRKLLTKLAKNPDNNIQFYKFTKEEETILKEFNLSRNWNNHIPESLLTSEIEMIRQGKASGHIKNPIEINMYNYVTLNYINDLYISAKSFQYRARKMLQSAKKDYSLLIGESVRVFKKYIDEPRDIDDMIATKLSAKVQGLPVDDIKIN